MTEEPVKRGGISGWFIGNYGPYLRKILPLFELCVFIFFFSLAMGYVLGDTIPGQALQDLMGSLPNPNSISLPALFAIIFANNSVKALLFMFGGVLAGIPPLVFVVLNGFVVGWVAWSLGSTQGLGFVVAGLTPHGVIEIPTILLSMAMGMSLGYELINRMRGKGNLGGEAKLAFGFFITRIVPLLLLAAAVEVIITPAVIFILGYK